MASSDSTALRSGETVVLLGTKRGLFTVRSRDRVNWECAPTTLAGTRVYNAALDQRGGRRRIYAADNGDFFGTFLRYSDDFGQTWQEPERGIQFPEDSGLKLENIWTIVPGRPSEPNVVYVGVDPASLWVSEDAGVTWSLNEGLAQHPTRKDWQPGAGGLCLHTIAVDPADNQRVFVAISTGGLYASEDGGESWEPRNGGLPIMFPDEGPTEGEPPQCVHHFELAAGDSSTIYQQHHFGMFASHDTGRSWENVGEALPSTFGFAAAAHPRDKDTWYLAPLNGDSIGRFMPEGRAAIWKTTDGGKSWRDCRAGLPQESAFFGVLRQGMAVDALEPAGIYAGTNGGSIFASSDEGETWTSIAEYLPSISSVETALIED